MMDPQEQAAVNRLNAAIDATHRDMTAFRELPHGAERRKRFTSFLRGMEAIHDAAFEYEIVHFNRVTREGR